jgi:cytochrome P450
MTATRRLPPSPRGHFLIGHTLQILREPFDFPVRCLREHRIVRLRLGTMVLYLLSDPDAIEQVLRRDHKHFVKDKGTRLLADFLGEGLVTSEGDHWRRQRRLAQPAFQADQIPNYGAVMVRATERLLQSWQPGQTRDLHAEMARLTMDIAAQVFLGSSIAAPRIERVRWALNVVMEHFASWTALIGWLRWLPTPGNRRYRRAGKELNAVVYEVIAQRRADGPTDGDDLLSRLLTARDEDGSQMTDQQLRDELVTLFLAGHETTAVALAFTFYLLAQHPAAEARLVAELDEVLHGQAPTAAHVPRLRYTEGVVKEALRLYPPVPNIGREARCDCEVAGYFVPKGTQVAPVQWVAHRDPRWFDDPESFRPERWDNDLARRLPRGAYFPFGDGPRICIGNTFAMLEAMLIVATVLQRFGLGLVPGHRLELLPSITLRPKQGLPLVVQERTKGAHGSGLLATP